MKNQTSTVEIINSAPSSFKGEGKKIWRQPQLTQLDLKETKGGRIVKWFEDPYNAIFYS